MPRGVPGHDLIQKITPENRQKTRNLKLLRASQDFLWPRWRNRRCVGSGTGRGAVLLIAFDREHQTAIRRGENGGRTLQESNVVRSIRAIGNWDGTALRVSEQFPEGQDIAVIPEAPDGKIVGASRLAGS
jgi:hypothetical protein